MTEVKQEKSTMTEVKQKYDRSETRKEHHDRSETKELTELKLNSENSDRIEMI